MTNPAELIIHIGHYKTGTTALQVFFTANAAQLEAQGLIYAPFPLKLHKHSPLAYVLLRDAGVTTLLHGFKSDLSAPQMWAQVFDTVRALPSGQSLLVSSEEFMRLGAHPAATETLRDIIASAPDIPVRIIAYLREPQAHLLSWYNQMVKMGVSHAGFETAVRTQMEVIHWDYARALAPWIDIFGADRVILRPFHDGLRAGDALFSDFLEALGFAMPFAAIPPKDDPNLRMDDRVADLKRAYTRAGLPPNIVKQAVIRAERNLADEAGAAALDPAPDFAAIRDVAQAGLQTLAALPGATPEIARLAEGLPRPLSPDAHALSDLVALLAGELAHMRGLARLTNARLDALEKRLDPTTPPAGDDA